MGNQLELQLSDARTPLARRARGVAASAWRAAIHALPVWAPLVFLAQLFVLGLWRANQERLRLDRAEREMRVRVESLQAEEREASTRARMLSDEVFRERVRRSLVDPGNPPLTIERARTGAGS